MRSSFPWRNRNGFYIALHPWLQAAGFVKIGFSKSVETRLTMPSFKNCFTDEWYYFSVFECESPKEALLLEQAVLYCMADKRVLHRELLQARGDEVVQVTRLLVRTLNLSVVEKPLPAYGTLEKHDISSARCKSSGDFSSGKLDFEGDDNESTGENTCEETSLTSAGSEEEGVSDAVLQQTIAPYRNVLQRLRTTMRRSNSPIDEENTYIEHASEISAEAVAGDAAKVHDCTLGTALYESTAIPHSPNRALERDRGSYALSPQTERVAVAALIDTENHTLESLRAYQREAVDRVMSELERTGRTICQMACRCGKTPVAYCVMREIVQPATSQRRKTATGRALYLVPGLSLLRQTALKLFGYGFDRVPMLLIGSDPNPVFLGPLQSRALSMTTDPATIQAFLLQHSHCVVLCTYHSSPLLENLANMFALTVFDECHRVCGSSVKTTFNTILLLPPNNASKRLFLTATPTYDTPIRMSDERLFGGIAYRYYLREGIDSGFVNPFCVRVVLGRSLDNMVPYIMEAMRLVNKMLIFCRNIKHAELLYQQLVSSFETSSESSGGTERVEPFASFIAHSQMGSTRIATALAEFSAHRRCVLFNVRLFQEGVEIPDLNAVFFAAPRYSSRDIIQSVCRPLNRLPNKPISYVFLPAAMNTRYHADHPINLHNFSTLVPFTDALMDEDPTLFEYMLDPQKKSYDLNVVGLRSLKLSSEKIEKFVLPAVRRGVRYSCTTQSDRLHRAARLPWKYVFAEMKRIVTECNRYPKTNDAWVVGDTSVSMNLFYRYCRKGYMLYQTGEQTYLQTYQLRDLESLPMWQRYGVEGPYPWKECLQTLEAYLVEHRSAPPPLDVHKGGFVGLDATPLERLSGCLMHVNQCDGKQELRLAPDKQRDMDALCDRHGLKWRKRRNADGTLRKNERTFITDSYDEFKRLYSRIDEDPVFKAYVGKHYPGYPEKHARMENLEILMDGKVPPRHEPMKRRGKRGSQGESIRTSETVETNGREGSSSAGAGAAKPTQRNSARRKPRKGAGAQAERPPKSEHIAPSERFVMCRICRIKVNAAQWGEHMTSPEHTAAAAKGNLELRADHAFTV